MERFQPLIFLILIPISDMIEIITKSRTNKVGNSGTVGEGESVGDGEIDC